MLFHFPSKIRFDKPLANLMPNDTHKRWDNHLFCFFKCLFQPQTNCFVLLRFHWILLSELNFRKILAVIIKNVTSFKSAHKLFFLVSEREGIALERLYGAVYCREVKETSIKHNNQLQNSQERSRCYRFSMVDHHVSLKNKCFTWRWNR